MARCGPTRRAALIVAPLEVDIRAIAAGGDGVGSLPDGRTVFVPRTAPGDRVILRNVRARARMARGEVAAIVVPGAGRVEPPCPHYVRDRCGSCQLMHLSGDVQREVKARIAGDALRRIAKRDVADPPMVPAPSALGYRSKVTLAVKDNRIGYHVLGEPDRVFDVRRCLIAEPQVQELIDAMRSARRHLPQDATRIVLRRDRENRLHITVRTASTQVWGGARGLHADIATQGLVVTVWWHPEDGAPRAMAGSDDPWPATVFEQVHPAMGDLVRRDAIAALGSVEGLHAWDLYAGVGDTTALLVEAGASVDSVERDRRAVAAAELAGPPGPVRRAGTAEALVGTLRPPDVIITNPPRTGMGEEVVAAIAATAVRRVAYISCDPATLARDIARLGDRFVLRDLRAYDQFPQTVAPRIVGSAGARMKYFVTIGDTEIEVEVDGDQVTIDGVTVTASIEQVGDTPEHRLSVAGNTSSLAVDRHAEGSWRLVDQGSVVDVEVTDERTRHIRSLGGAARAASGAAPLKAPMPGLVVRIGAAVGDTIAAGQGIVVLEAMKMENELKVSSAGTVKAIKVEVGQTVEKGQVLVEFEAVS